MSSFQIRAEILGNMDNFARTMRKAEKQLQGMEKVSKTVSTAMKGAFVGVALAGLNMLWDGMVAVTKAAQDEAKSMAILGNAIENSWGSTASVKGQEEFIKRMSYMSAIADDQLRPAYAKIVRVTKDSTKAQKAFERVLNISAATGKDVNVVSQAMSKYLGGNKTALDKLVPGLKDAGDKMKYLDETYAGAADSVGDASPFSRLQLVIDDIQERLGGYLLPYLQDFADWATSPEAQTMIDDAFKGIEAFFDYMKTDEGKDSIDRYVSSLKTLADTLVKISDWVSKNGWIFEAMGAGQTGVNTVLGAATNPGDFWGKLFGGKQPRTTAMPQMYAQGTSPIQVKVDVSGSFDQSGKFIVKSLKQEASKKGTTVGKMIQ